MRYLLVTVVSWLGALPCYCQGQKQAPKTATRPALLVYCEIRSDSVARHLSKGQSSIFHISVENASSKSVKLTGMAAFLATDSQSPVREFDDFDALIDIKKKSSLELVLDSHGHYREQNVRLKPGQVLAFDIDIVLLKWMRMTSSVLGGSSFWTIVTPNSYSECITITGKDTVGHFEVKSNRIRLEVLP